ncbi:hypothetical protein ACFTWD_31080 [Streptomyces sp. NPDC056943]|uniref:hypothetical protein n=1 Tax=Streptomyces sp. NPDC056943 TaxID=3345971 RepID=UPI003624BA71
MNRTRTGRYGTRPRLAVAAAVATALAVTAGGTAGASAPTTAFAATMAAEQDVAVPFPVDATVVSAGPTGFLSAQSGEQLTWRWTRYADGVATVLPPGSYRGAKQTDIVARTDGSGVYTLSDMATGGDPLEVDTRPLGEGSFPPTAVGDVDRDGRPDLVAYRNQTVYFAKGTGDWKAPFAPVRESTYLPTNSYAQTVF